MLKDQVTAVAVPRMPWFASTVPYLLAWVVSMAGAQWIQYVWPQAVLVKGQPPSIVFMGALWLVSLVLWWFARWPSTRSRGFLALIGVLAAAWAVHLGFTFVHGDNFNHVVWIYPPMLAMLALKPPSAEEAWRVLVGAAWAIAAILMLTRSLELMGVLERYFVLPYVVKFDLANYWLPFSGSFGLLGKWTGPFGASAHTAMAAGFVFVIGVARWSRSSWVFVAVGVLVYLLSASRSMLLAMVAAVMVMALFSSRGVLGRFPGWARWVLLGIVSVAGAAALFMTGPGLTGRQNIWPAFLDVWRTSPWIGVGRNGIEGAGGLAAESDVAHNLFIDLLARFGIAGLVLPVAAVAIACWLCLVAASRGVAGPAAILVAYLIFSMTDVRNEWITMNLPLMLVVLATAWAASVPKPEPVRLPG